MVDLFLQLVVMASIALPSAIASQYSVVGNSMMAFLIRSGLALTILLLVLVPAGMAWIEWSGWKTPGRYLFQLRVVDFHGLRLTRRKRLLRNLIRNAPIWILAFSFVSFALNLGTLYAFLGPVGEILIIINALPILGPARRTLHDRLFGSHVVLDTTK